jgi:WD40 repeat protein
MFKRRRSTPTPPTERPPLSRRQRLALLVGASIVGLLILPAFLIAGFIALLVFDVTLPRSCTGAGPLDFVECLYPDAVPIKHIATGGAGREIVVVSEDGSAQLMTIDPLSNKRAQMEGGLGTNSVWSYICPGTATCAAMDSSALCLVTSCDEFQEEGYETLGNGIVQWETGDPELRRRFRGHSAGIEDIVFGPDDEYFASASRDKTVKLWQMASDEPIHTFEGHDAAVIGVDFSPTGKLLASIGADRRVFIWDVRAGKRVRTISGPKLAGRCVAFSRDGNWLVTPGKDHVILAFEAKTGKVLPGFVGHTSPVEALTFSPDGTWLASGGTDGTWRLWDVKTRTLVTEERTWAEFGAIRDLAFGRKYLAVAHRRKIIEMWKIPGK